MVYYTSPIRKLGTLGEKTIEKQFLTKKLNTSGTVIQLIRSTVETNRDRYKAKDQQIYFVLNRLINIS